jgi:diamine N-acetyltransferase
MDVPDYVLEGERVALGPLRKDLADTYRRWLHDLDVRSIDWRFGRCTFGILVGAGRGRGLGTGATRLTLDWGFNILGLHNIMLTVLPSNAAGIRAYEKAGFKRIGVRRSALVLLGQRCDEVLMDAVPAEFESPVLAARR